MPFNPTLLNTAEILTPEEALAVLASRGQWADIAQAIARLLDGASVGSVVRMAEVGLVPSDFTNKAGEVTYAGLAGACKSRGVMLKRLTDETRGFYVPANSAELIEKAKATRAAAAAKAKAKQTPKK